jgi:hypothetical protein
MLWGSETEKLRQILEAGARAFTADELAAMREMGARHKPVAYDEWASGLRLRYEGKQANLVREALARRYPKTAKHMPVNPINWLRFFASQDAGVYDEQPERYLVTGDDRLDEEDARHEELRWLTDAADLEGVCPELETRALAALTIFVAIDWDRVADIPKLRPYWPADVVCICHPSAPDDFDRCVVFGHKIAGPAGVSEGEDEWFRVFSRSWTDGPDGLPTFGKWRVHVMSKNGNSYFGPEDAATEVEGRLPVCILQVGMPDGSVFVDADRDLVDTVDGLNCERSNLQYISDLQGHTPVWYAGTYLESDAIEWGPDTLTKVGPQESLQTLALSPAFEELRESRKLATRELASSRGNSPDAYTVEPGAPLSGISRRVQNLAHERRLKRLSHIFKRFEEQQLLPLLMDAHDLYSARPVKFGAEVEARMTPPSVVTYEEPQAIMQRMGDAADRGWLTEAQAAARSLPEVYPTVDDAVKAGLSNELGEKPPVGTSSFQLRLADAEARKGASVAVGQDDIPTVPDGKPVVDKTPAPASDETSVNELTLGIERLGRLGDIETLNIMRRALAQKLGVAYGGDLSSSDLAQEATTVLSAETKAAKKPEG